MKRPFLQIVSEALQRWDRWRGDQCWMETGAHMKAVGNYNRSVGDRKITRTRRAEELYKLLDIKGTDDVLIVGPRDVHELYMAWCYGASWQRITGLDLSSRNPKILVGDMAATPFPAESFDVIVSSATISYLEAVFAGVKEMYRILRRGGSFAFTHAYDPESEWKGNHVTLQLMRQYLFAAGFDERVYMVRDKISALRRRVEIMTCVVTK